MSLLHLGHQFDNFAILFNIFCSFSFCKILQYLSILFRSSISDVEQIIWPVRGIVSRGKSYRFSMERC